MASEQELFQALADPTRRAILGLLGGGEMTGGDLAQRFELSWPSVSRHLSLLKSAGLVSSRRDRQRLVYRLEKEALMPVTEKLASISDGQREAFPLAGRSGVGVNDQARAVLRRSFAEAASLGHDKVETTHLLLALLHHDDCNACRLLSTFGLSYDGAREQVVRLHGTRPAIDDPTRIPVDGAYKELTGVAAGTALRAGQRHIGTTTLLMTLLRESVSEDGGRTLMPGRAIRVLQTLEIDLEALQAAASQELLGSAVVDPEVQPLMDELAASTERHWSQFVALEQMITDLQRDVRELKTSR